MIVITENFRTNSLRGIALAAVLFAAIAAAVFFATPADAATPQCQFKTGCMSKALCDKYDGTLIACPELGDKCAQTGFGLCYPDQSPIPLKISIAGRTSVLDIGDYIATAYRWSIGAAAVVAAVMLMVGGLQYLTSAAGSSVSAAKERISNAVVGLAIAAFAYLILSTVNPALVSLVVPRVPLVPPQKFVACDEYKMQYQCGADFGLKEVSNDSGGVASYAVTAPDDPESIATCTGNSCSKAGSWDATHTCIDAGSGSPPEDPPKDAPVPPYQCSPCAPFGSSCDGLGPSTSCCSGFCGASESETLQATGGVGEAVGLSGTCSSGLDGTECSRGEECRGGYCVSDGSGGGVCTSGVAGAPCLNNSDCSGGMSCVMGRCSAQQAGSLCGTTQHCPGSQCTRFAKEAPKDVQTTPYHVPGMQNTIAGYSLSVCGGPSAMPPCSRNEDCGSGQVCWKDLPDEMKEGLGSATGRCKSLAPGALCKTDSDCADPNVTGSSAYCCTTCRGTLPSLKIGVCVEPAGGAGCDVGKDSQCQGSKDPNMKWAICNDSGLGGGVCTYPGVEGAPCVSKGGGSSSCAMGADGKRLICPDGSGGTPKLQRCVAPKAN
jgi:hypothetical protein